MSQATFGEKPVWGLRRPHIGLIRLVIAWLLATVALLVAAWIVPGAARTAGLDLRRAT